MPIFISYRRTSTSDIAGRIDDRLRAYFGENEVFRDVDDIPAGSDFRQVLASAVQKCDVFLALVGGDYFDRRIKNPDDFVRVEIESALRQRASIIPVLVGAGTLPRKTRLPQSVAQVINFQAVSVSSGRDFEDNVRFLIAQITKA